MKRIAAITALALALGTFAQDATASESLSTRAVTAIGIAIAAQGDAALVQISRDLKESAIEAMKPFLPDPAQAPNDASPAETPVAQH